jgi:hypothetical protein
MTKIEEAKVAVKLAQHKAKAIAKVVKKAKEAAK